MNVEVLGSALRPLTLHTFQRGNELIARASPFFICNINHLYLSRHAIISASLILFLRFRSEIRVFIVIPLKGDDSEGEKEVVVVKAVYLLFY